MNKLYHVDFIEGLDKVNNGSIQLCIIDPYFSFYRDKFVPEVYEKLISKMKNSGILAFFCNSKCLLDLIESLSRYKESVERAVGLKIHINYTWDIINNVSINGAGNLWNPREAAESIVTFYLSKNKPKFNPRAIPGRYYNQKLKYNRERPLLLGGKKVQPKPIGLLQELVLYYTDPGDNVLDLFSGSGRLALICKYLDRNYTGFEINKNVFNYANLLMKKTKTLNLECAVTN